MAVARQRRSRPSSRIATARARARPWTTMTASMTPSRGERRDRADGEHRPGHRLALRAAGASAEDHALEEVAVDVIADPSGDLVQLPGSGEDLDHAPREVLEQRTRRGGPGCCRAGARRSRRRRSACGPYPARWRWSRSKSRASTRRLRSTPARALMRASEHRIDGSGCPWRSRRRCSGGQGDPPVALLHSCVTPIPVLPPIGGPR